MSSSSRAPKRELVKAERVCRSRNGRSWSIHSGLATVAALNPFLNDDTSLLQLRRVSQSHTLVRHFLVGKRSHEVVGTTGAGGVGAVDKVVDVADGVGCVEARLQSSAVTEADLK